MRACSRLLEHFTLASPGTDRASLAVPFKDVRDALEGVLKTEGNATVRADAWRQAARSGQLPLPEGIPAYEGEAWKASIHGWATLKNSGQVASDPAFKFLQAATMHRDYVLRDLLPEHGICLT